VRRRFASVLLGMSIQTNEITGETSFGFVLKPYGTRGGLGLQGVGGDALGIGSRLQN